MALRFAALIRVSTPGQAKRTKESLPVQRSHIERSVKLLDGRIVAWYGGQEHATPGHEHAELERLLVDAASDKFDAVMVSHADRWSRDNAASKRGLEVFRKNNVRFFVLSTEHDLFNPSARLFLGLSAEIGEYQAAVQRAKSQESRLAKAKRGCCVVGKRPWGRIWDKQNETWSIDQVKQNMIRDIAERYLQGESLSALATEYNQNPSNLHKTLTQRCGDKWLQTFKHEDGHRDEVWTSIPRLLSDKTIRAIKKQLAANKTYSHGEIVNRYLLSRMIFCAHCKYTMFGQTNDREEKRRYYRHAHHSRNTPCPLPKTWIPADEIEELVMLHLFGCFGNAVAVQKAVDAATPNLAKLKQYEQRIERIDGELEKIENNRQKVLGMVMKGTISDEQAEKRLLEAKERDALLHDERGRLCEALSSRLSDDQIKNAAHRVERWFASAKPFSQMTYEEKRGLCEMVFSGKRQDGSRMGVYIEWDEDKNWTFSIHGHLVETGLIRWSEKMKQVMREHYENGASWSETAIKGVSKSSSLCTAAGPRERCSRPGTARFRV